MMQGKVALVTGAGAGIGRATAVALASKGCKVIVGDVNDDAGNETVQLLSNLGAEALFVHADVARSEDVQNLVRSGADRFGGLDCCVNNAGIAGGPIPVADYPEELFNKVVSINLVGVFLCMKYEIPELLKRPAGSIVNVGSVMSFVGQPGGVAYDSCKHGVLGMTKSAAIDYGRQGLRINCICPGWIYTPMIEAEGRTPGTEGYQAVAEQALLGRMGRPEEVAEAIVWLCLEESSFVTGTGLVVDGGYLAH